MKNIGAIVLCGILLVVLINTCAAKTVQGRVEDAITGKGIPDVTVTARQIGWGRIDGHLVWDKMYEFRTTTDNDGNFKLSYEHGGSSVHLIFSKNGYHSTKPGFPLQDTYVNYRERPVVRLAPD